MTRIIINGSKGRMGQALLSPAARIPEIEIVGAVDQGDDLAALLPGGRGHRVPSFHSVTLGVAELAAKRGKAIVIGTTGHKPEETRKFSRWAARFPW